MLVVVPVVVAVITAGKTDATKEQTKPIYGKQSVPVRQPSVDRPVPTQKIYSTIRIAFLVASACRFGCIYVYTHTHVCVCVCVCVFLSLRTIVNP